MTKRQGTYKGHNWTENELSLLCYLRYIRQWRFTQIQRVNFPSLSRHALGGAYRRLPADERIRRAVAFVSVVSNSCPTTEHSRGLRQAQTTFSSSEREPSQVNADTENEDTPLITNENSTKRYNFRPNRPTTFAERKPRYMVDRVHFPHFFESYSNHLKPYELPDSEYVPPSHTSTPSSSEYSHSINSSQPSEASSLELFGLEPRSLESPNDTPSIHSIRSSDTLSTEFFSTEES